MPAAADAVEVSGDGAGEEGEADAGAGHRAQGPPPAAGHHLQPLQDEERQFRSLLRGLSRSFRARAGRLFRPFLVKINNYI